MEYFLVNKDQWIIVDLGTAPTIMSAEDQEKLDQKAKSTIQLCLSDSILFNVPGEATTKALWDKLGSLYQSKSLVNKHFLQKNLNLLRMNDGDLMKKHLNAFDTMVSYLLSIDIKILN